ncbi:MAG: ComEC/Rec2 family competence protein [Hyphomicrobiales bacterium]
METDRWFLWIPVALGAGIAVYFTLPQEPPVLLAPAGLCAALVLAILLRHRTGALLACTGLSCVFAGMAVAQLRTASVTAPRLLGHAGAVQITGWVERRESRGATGYRLTIRVDGLQGRRELPGLYRVRITSRFPDAPAVGTAVSLRAVLRPLPAPSLPGGFDHARKAWFERIGASGWALGPPRALDTRDGAPSALRIAGAIDSVRGAIQQRIAALLPGTAGAVADALITGEKGRIPDEQMTALRHSGLAHILAISGMHMALFAGALFWAVRAVLAAIPGIALRVSVKKPAAIASLLGGTVYLLISGAGVATQRAWLMMAIVVLAVLLDRPAFTLRNVAIAALALLLARPESLFDVSFQMSFAAATALVAVYQAASADRREGSFTFHRLPGLPGKLLAYLGGIALSTFVAGLAVAPFSAYHFHNIAQYSLLANLLSLPIFGLAVMPMVLAAILLMPFGLAWGPLWIMGQGIDAITAVATWVASLDGAVLRVAAIPGPSLALLVLGGLWLCLWRGAIRGAGLVIAALGLILVVPLRAAPDILIGEEGRLAAIRTQGGSFAFTGTNRSSYDLEQWLLTDGDGRPVTEALKAEGFTCDEHACLANVKGKTVAIVRHPAALAEECARSDIVVASFPVRAQCAKARVVIDYRSLSEAGAHALYLEGQSIRSQSVAEARGRRPWVAQPGPARETHPGRAVAGEGGAQ